MSTGAPVRLAPELERLARVFGIETSYLGQGGRHVADPEVLVRVLRALGAPLERPDEAAEALAATRARGWRAPLPPVLVAWEGRPVRVGLRVPARLAGARLRLACRPLDTPGTLAADPTFLELAPGDAPPGGGARVDGEAFERRFVTLAAPPLGVHALEVELGDLHATSTLLSAPLRASAPDEARGWGAFLPLYALRTGRDWGIGDFGGLTELVRWVAEHGGTFAGTLPLGATIPSALVSPYTPSSRLFWNELFVDVEAVPELEGCEQARRLVESSWFQEELTQVRASRLVDHARVAHLKRRVLEELHRWMAARSSSRSTDLHGYLRRRPEAMDHARFLATVESQGRPWSAWPERLRQGALGPQDYDPTVAGYHAYVQWVADEQVERLARTAEGAGSRLYLDLPLGVHPDGYDAWRERSSFLQGLSVGAPPDAFFAGGQDWGFAPPDPRGIRASGYRYLAACVRHQMRAARLLRVDHVMGLHRLYVIPPGTDARSGVYLRYRPDEQYAVLAIEAARAGATIVGEDLGTVPPTVRADMARHALWRMYVLPFEVQPWSDPALHEPWPEALAGLGTHDTPTFLAFWRGLDLGARDDPGAEEARAERERWRQALLRELERRGLLPGGRAVEPEEVLAAALSFLAQSPALGLLVSLEDLWLEPEPQNVPGTTDQHPNWRRKSRYRLEELDGVPTVRTLLERIRRSRP